ncbi:hypothetical protein, partial [Pseudoalteromonas sp.]|uniref:hypothetical protein n=1 Tax=Pseudoalteromonas sp. TaxID=53249 RepID=UPI00260E7FB2
TTSLLPILFAVILATIALIIKKSNSIKVVLMGSDAASPAKSGARTALLDQGLKVNYNLQITKYKQITNYKLQDTNHKQITSYKIQARYKKQNKTRVSRLHALRDIYSILLPVGVGIAATLASVSAYAQDSAISETVQQVAASANVFSQSVANWAVVLMPVAIGVILFLSILSKPTSKDNSVVRDWTDLDFHCVLPFAFAISSTTSLWVQEAVANLSDIQKFGGCLIAAALLGVVFDLFRVCNDWGISTKFTERLRKALLILATAGFALLAFGCSSASEKPEISTRSGAGVDKIQDTLRLRSGQARCKKQETKVYSLQSIVYEEGSVSERGPPANYSVHSHFLVGLALLVACLAIATTSLLPILFAVILATIALIIKKSNSIKVVLMGSDAASPAKSGARTA